MAVHSFGLDRFYKKDKKATVLNFPPRKLLELERLRFPFRIFALQLVTKFDLRNFHLGSPAPCEDKFSLQIKLFSFQGAQLGL